MEGELFALGVIEGMNKAARASAKGMGRPADQTGMSTPVNTAKSTGGPAKSEAKRGPFNKTRQAGLDSRGVRLADENPNV